MRSPVDRRSAVLRRAAALSALALAAAAPAHARHSEPLKPAPAANGPLADYPVVIGPTYAVQGTQFVPEDTMNYDQVGYVAADSAGGGAISGSHHTLPLPSYVEVTSLATGKTVLVRLERRGPMNGTDLVALSPGALAQLGASAGTPVRVRRVNPPEEQRALLRAGQQAPLRMDTPMSLVEVLKRKLPGQGGATSLAQAPQRQAAPASAPAQPQLARAAAAPDAAAAPVHALTQIAVEPSHATGIPAKAPALPPLEPRGAAPAATDVPAQFRLAGVVSTPTSTPVAAHHTPVAALASLSHTVAPEPRVPSTAPAASSGDYVVQAGAYSTSDRAERVANVLGGKVSAASHLFRVRTGPFVTRSEAEASLAKVRAAGYSDARIQTSG